MIKNWLLKVKNYKNGLILFIGLITLFVAAGIFAGVGIYNIQSGYRVAQDEYEDLRQVRDEAISQIDDAPRFENEIEPEQELKIESETETLPEQEPEPEPEPDPDPIRDLLEINPDYIGWITIEGTNIDYPVVQGWNNYKYVYFTFSGEENKAGAIFMDYRVVSGFDSPAVILYGHNMKDGSMFGDLDFSLEGSNISITTLDGELLTYNIFSVRRREETNMIFRIIEKDEQGVKRYMKSALAPADATHLLVLSTCTENDNERLVVLATR